MRALAAALAALLCLGAAPQPAAVALDRLLADEPAPTLADYRLFTDAAARHPDPSLTPYALNTPLFSDYALKSRYLYLPPGTHATYRPQGALEFPLGATLVKTFAYPADFRRPGEKVRYIETRVLIHKRDGWAAYAYVWNSEQTEAVLMRAGTREEVDFIDAHGRARQISYHVPNQNQCKECHQLDRALTPIGPKARNLNGDYSYTSGRENQLAHWTRLGLLTGAPSPAAAPRTPVWDDAMEPLADRARAYLDGNCGHCHNPQGAASNSGLFLTLEQPEGPALGIGKAPVAAGKGSGDLKVDIAPGDADGSILAYRLASSEPGVMMPELGRSITHEEGVALIRAWIAGLKPSKPPQKP